MTRQTQFPAVLTSRFSLAKALPFALVAFACGGSQPEAAPPPPPPPVEAPLAAAPTPPPVAPAETAKAPPLPAEPTPPPSAWRVADGIMTPESVLYDAAADRYLVSNINGSTTGVDNNGYITEISGDGKVTKAKFIEGGAKTKLDAPKGLGISGNTLYVSDITVVRKFDAKTGAPKGEIPIKDTTFLNDIAVAADGRIFVSDSGLKEGAGGGFEPTGTDAVYVIDKAGKVKPLAKSKDLGGPNGILSTDKGVLVVTFGSDEVYRLNAEGVKEQTTKLPGAALDGLVAVGDSLFISSWKTSTVYKGTLGGKFEPIIAGVKGPADIGFDTKRNRILVPRFMDNAVEAYDVK